MCSGPRLGIAKSEASRRPCSLRSALSPNPGLCRVYFGPKGALRSCCCSSAWGYVVVYLYEDAKGIASATILASTLVCFEGF